VAATAEQIDTTKQLRETIIGRCDEIAEYEGMINMGRQAEYYIKNFRTVSAW
jgi:hypothetical protein